jgi:hypothetical protein
MQVLQEIMALLNNVEFKTAKLTNDMPNTKESLTTFKQLERVALRYMALTRQMGLGEDANKVLETLSRIIITARMAQIAFQSMWLAAGPIGWVQWASFGASAGIVAMSARDLNQMW